MDKKLLSQPREAKTFIKLIFYSCLWRHTCTHPLASFKVLNQVCSFNFRMSQKPAQFSSAVPTTKKPNWTENNFAVQYAPKSALTATAISPEAVIAKLASWGPPAISDALQTNSGRCARNTANAGMENGLSVCDAGWRRVLRKLYLF